jgi:hypothetical protein
MSMSFGINLLGHMYVGISWSHIRLLGGGRSVGLRMLTTKKFYHLSVVYMPSSSGWFTSSKAAGILIPIRRKSYPRGLYLQMKCNFLSLYFSCPVRPVFALGGLVAGGSGLVVGTSHLDLGDLVFLTGLYRHTSSPISELLSFALRSHSILLFSCDFPLAFLTDR